MRHKLLAPHLVFAVLFGLHGHTAFASDPIRLPNGFSITPDAAPHSVLTPLNPGMPGRRDVTLGQPVNTVLSPDGGTLLVLTSGYNREGNQRFDEHVFVFDVTS